MTKYIDPVGRETISEYDPANDIDLLRVQQWNGMDYDLLQEFGSYVNHEPGTVTDASGQMTTYTHNSQGRVLTVTTPARAGISEISS